MTLGALVLLAALAVAAAVGGWRLVHEGRFRGRRTPSAPTGDQYAAPVPAALAVVRAVGAQPGELATLLQFSSAFCAPCRATRVVLGAVAAEVPGVAHVEVDAEQHLDHVRRLGVLRTPTTLVLDATGRETGRASGAPRREQVLAALPRTT